MLNDMNSEMPGVSRRGGVGHSRSALRGHHGPADLATHSEIVGREAGESEVGHKPNVLQDHVGVADLANIIGPIRELWRQRQAWHRAEKSLTLQAKALCRRLAVDGDKKEADTIYKAALGKGEHPQATAALLAMLPLDEARKTIEGHRKGAEKRLAKLAKALPVAPWVEGTRGVGLASLAAIVGEAGDLSSYANPAKLWKRMGLAVMPDGRQRRVAGVAALDHGYSPSRRSVMWNVGACIVKAGGPLKAVYDAEKTRQLGIVATKLHAHNRAQRYAEKRFLKLLLTEWHRLAKAPAV